MRKLVIFDLDGVLFETRDMHFRLLNQALMLSGRAPISAKDHAERFNGLPTKQKLEMLGISDMDAKCIQDRKQRLTLEWIGDNVVPSPSLIRLCSDLRAARYTLAVVSNAKYNTVKTVLQKLCLPMPIRVTAEDGLPAKPSPAMYFHAMGLCDSDPENTVIVEDSPVGLEGARATGARVIAVTSPEDAVVKVREALL